MTLEERLQIFSEMVRCCHNLYLWHYDAEFRLLSSDCPAESQIDAFINLSNFRDAVLEHQKNHHTPLILTNQINLMCVAVFHTEEGKAQNVYVLGPFFIDDYSTRALEIRLRQLNLSLALRDQAVSFLKTLPVISLSRVMEYAIMLHFAVTRQTIATSDLNYYEDTCDASFNSAGTIVDSHGTYEAEQEMLRIVREGDIEHFKQHMDKMVFVGKPGKLSNGNSSRQMKNLVLVCITLFSRAAIEGGLLPEIAMTLTDYYFQNVEACNSIAELTKISHSMQEDFVQRVYKIRRNQNFSKPIRACCEYIEMHLEEPIALKELADFLGYSEYYLSKKFKSETGSFLKDYIREKRIERAKFLLKNTSLTMQEISARLQFNSQSYFTETFRKAEGITPTEYRK